MNYRALSNMAAVVLFLLSLILAFGLIYPTFASTAGIILLIAAVVGILGYYVYQRLTRL